MNQDSEHLREGVRVLIQASSNTKLTAFQAQALLLEAKANCDIAFGSNSDAEFSLLIKEHVRSLLNEV